MNIFQLVLAAVVAITVIPVEAYSAPLAPLHEARSFGKKQITDNNGLVYYIVDLADNAHEAQPDQRTVQGRQRFHERHSGKAQNMVEAFEKQYGFNYVDMTSWVGNSFSAYLNDAQVVKLRADPRVNLISEVVEATFSAIWGDTTHPSSEWPYSETSSWGRNAVNGKTSNHTRRIYIIDGGVGYHQDLPTDIQRVNPSSGISPIGCYPHATHVAGIIGAAYGNKGVAGVNAGAKLISVSTLPNNQTYYPYMGDPVTCADSHSMTSSSIASAMDWVKWDIVINGAAQTGIVSLSINAADFMPEKTLNAKMRNLATPYIGGYYYPGAFIAQSAGNDYASACTGGTNGLAAFGYPGGIPSTTDGIMVVGAINDNMDPVMPPNPSDPSSMGFNNGIYAGSERGSNYGTCVEVWAPGNNIYSTWGPNVGLNPSNSSTWQNQSVTYDNYVNLSGTSMAAPHVAAVAAYLAETRGLGSPGEIETAVRSLFYYINFPILKRDSAGVPMAFISLP